MKSMILVRRLTVIVSILSVSFAYGHTSVRPESAGTRAIEFPDTDDYKTLVVDLHTHSVFSDGHVWPTVRIAEAQKDGLDGIAITEHLEFQPHISDIPHPDRNRSFEEAKRAARDLNLVVIPGVEITRQGDPGHINAIFVKDANLLVKQRQEHVVAEEDMFPTREEAQAASAKVTQLFPGAHQIEHKGRMVWMPFETHEMYLALANYAHATTLDARTALQAASEQGAFTFWNHPNFETVDAELNKFHAAAVKDKILHGIEIANGDRYYENAHRLALKHDLALIGVSDVHELIEWDYRPEAAENPGHRPVTLVLAKDESMQSMREALFARRTVVWWKNTLIGRAQHLNPLLEASVSIAKIDVESWGIRVTLHNHSDARFLLKNQSDLQLSNHAQLIELTPNDNIEVAFSMDKPGDRVKLKFEVVNALVAPNESAVITLSAR